jgi:hypothetical protein
MDSELKDTLPASDAAEITRGTPKARLAPSKSGDGTS